MGASFQSRHPTVLQDLMALINLDARYSRIHIPKKLVILNYLTLVLLAYNPFFLALCGPNNEGLEIDIAFSTSDGFESILTVCFDPAQSRFIFQRLQNIHFLKDPSNSRSIYAVHTLYQEIVARDTGNDRPFFDPDIYYPFDVNNYYTQVEQDATIQRLTGIDYVDPSTDYYLARGHLSPNSDFIYYSWQVCNHEIR